MKIVFQLNLILIFRSWKNNSRNKCSNGSSSSVNKTCPNHRPVQNVCQLSIESPKCCISLNFFSNFINYYQSVSFFYKTRKQSLNAKMNEWQKDISPILYFRGIVLSFYFFALSNKKQKNLYSVPLKMFKNIFTC